MSEKKTSPMIWIAVGCGLLSVFGCCVGSGVAYLAYNQSADPLYFGGDAPAWVAEDPMVAGGGAAPSPAPGPLIIPTTPMPSMTTHSIVASVQSVTGSIPVTVGSICYVVVEVRAQPQAPAGYWCKSTVTCNNTVLYGETDTNGFFTCTIYDNPVAIIGEDGDTTAADTDGAIQLETNRRTLILGDDASGARGAFRVEANITEVH